MQSIPIDKPYEIVKVIDHAPNVIIQLVGKGSRGQKPVHVKRVKPYYRQGFYQGAISKNRHSEVQALTLEEPVQPFNDRNVKLRNKITRSTPKKDKRASMKEEQVSVC